MTSAAARPPPDSTRLEAAETHRQWIFKVIITNRFITLSELKVKQFVPEWQSL